MTGTTDFTIKSLGPCRIPSPLKLELEDGTPYFTFVSDETKILYEVEKTNGSGSDISFEKAGPRENIYYDLYYLSFKFCKILDFRESQAEA